MFVQGEGDPRPPPPAPPPGPAGAPAAKTPAEGGGKALGQRLTTRRGAKAGAKAGGGRAPSTEDIAAYQKVATCLRGQGLQVPEPKVGVPFDSSAVDNLFGTDKEKFGAVLTACPDYKKVVVGVG